MIHRIVFKYETCSNLDHNDMSDVILLLRGKKEICAQNHPFYASTKYVHNDLDKDELDAPLKWPGRINLAKSID